MTIWLASATTSPSTPSTTPTNPNRNCQQLPERRQALGGDDRLLEELPHTSRLDRHGRLRRQHLPRQPGHDRALAGVRPLQRQLRCAPRDGGHYVCNWLVWWDVILLMQTPSVLLRRDGRAKQPPAPPTELLSVARRGYGVRYEDRYVPSEGGALMAHVESETVTATPHEKRRAATDWPFAPYDDDPQGPRPAFPA